MSRGCTGPSSQADGPITRMYNIPDDMESLDVLTDLRDSTELIDQLHVDLKAVCNRES